MERKNVTFYFLYGSNHSSNRHKVAEVAAAADGEWGEDGEAQLDESGPEEHGGEGVEEVSEAGRRGGDDEGEEKEEEEGDTEEVEVTGLAGVGVAAAEGEGESPPATGLISRGASTKSSGGCKDSTFLCMRSRRRRRRA